ncbi:MAG: CDP-diacylglycerol--glycerol-3-phosphate 3-phosphatidyltransferase [Clostridia bacterium]|nr:CDP-diacylglycerol--glycerol-3-phosphate 3-phosphatidyltransferase [Clostridia bacterium]
MKKRDIPNAICWFRIALIPLVLFFLVESNLTAWLPYSVSLFLSGILFAVAMISDAIDGRIARKYNYVSDLGKFLDPIADKMLVLSVCVAFAGIGAFGHLMLVSVIAILLRELMISGLRLSAASKGIVIAANWWGKIKTILQAVAIGVTYVFLLLESIPACNEFTPWYFLLIPEILFAINALYAWISAIPYIKACAPYLKG